MRVVIAPDGFKGTLSATDAARAIVSGWSESRPDDSFDVVPMSDGGPGFLDALRTSKEGDLVDVEARDPLGRRVACNLLIAGDVVYVESSQACGLHLLVDQERDPLRAWTAGVGDLVAGALCSSPGRIVIGLGGSATNDGGAGMLDALGLGMRDRDGEPLSPAARSLDLLDHVENVRPFPPSPPGPDLVAASDVDSPLLGPKGASAVFGPQKGASPEDAEELDRLLAHLSSVVTRDVPGTEGLECLPGAGAAGGLGYGLAVLGASRVSGVGLVLEATGLGERLRAADLVITGEGTFDAQSLRGKVVSGVASAARAAGAPCVVLAGRVDLSADEGRVAGVQAAYSVSAMAGSLEASLESPALQLKRLAREVAGQPHGIPTR